MFYTVLIMHNCALVWIIYNYGKCSFHKDGDMIKLHGINFNIT